MEGVESLKRPYGIANKGDRRGPEWISLVGLVRNRSISLVPP